MEYCGAKIQFMISSGALTPWALFPKCLAFRLLDFIFLRVQQEKSFAWTEHNMPKKLQQCLTA
jgi:hypothetical protein